PFTSAEEMDLPAALAAAPIVTVLLEIPGSNTKSKLMLLMPVDVAAKVIGKSTEVPAVPETLPTVIVGILATVTVTEAVSDLPPPAAVTVKGPPADAPALKSPVL